MKKGIVEFVAKCQNCQQMKYEHQRSVGLLQRIPIPKWNWEMIAMDFVGGFPKTLGKFDSIWVVVDRLAMSANFISDSIVLDKDLQYEEEPIAVFYRDVHKLRTKEIKFVKVQWKHRPIEEATWETEKDMRDKYLQLFVDSGTTPFFF
ncbi:hypothetical protein MTR67_003378 [Solanum verrucosum]|uniref:Uncharacterized protein n=1 Tax=Solanum verrucosum TaxID=315347 RepID=A0AAF0PSC3_SOLVR|nr:hypothetical protein MTR67_003378 [Solanum verrucosum]